MTAQTPEELLYQGEMESLCTEPLRDYFSRMGIEQPFEAIISTIWRGYIGTWEIIEDRLYLIELSGELLDGSKASLETFFPGFPHRVFAHWFTGTLYIRQGKLLSYVHMGYASIFERELLIEVEQGVVQSTRTAENGKAEDDAPEDDAIAAHTILPLGDGP